MEFKSVNKLIEQSIRDNWERPALSNYQGVTLFYKDVASRIEHLHICFKRCGLQRGDKVALCSRNQVNWGVCFLAAMTYGAVPVPILHEFKAGNIHYLVNHSEAKVLFIDDVLWENMAGAEMPGLYAIVQMNTLKYLSVRDILPDIFADESPDGFSPDAMNYYRDSAEELAMINYTSGTSGFSKGVMIPYRALYCNILAAGVTAEPQMNNKSRMVSILPTAHMYGMMFEFLFEMTIGAHVYFLTRVPSPKIIVNAFSEVKPDVMISVPLVLEKIYRTQVKPLIDRRKIYMYIPVLNKLILQKVRSSLLDALGGRLEEVILGGAPLNPEVEKFLKKMNFPFTVGYGMTECAPLVTYSKWNKTKLGSCGLPIPGCSVRIDSADPKNVPGEIQIKGANVFLGYFKNEEATASSFTEDGWFKTGDMGVIDSEGYLFLRGRLKCMILGSSGQNIYPEEIEAMLNNIDYVVDSLVIEEKGGLTALVYPDYHLAEKDGMDKDLLTQRLEQEIDELNKDLPNYAQIRKIELMPEDFERTPKRSIKRYLYQRQ